MKSILLLFILVVLSGCTNTPTPQQIEEWKAEVVAAEKAFNDMAAEEGIAKAFAFFAAEDGVILRQRTTIKGKAAIAEFYANPNRTVGTLSWSPTFVDVSQSGDLAYTYGDFTFSFPDSLGNTQTNKGIFHTVWKRQADGAWRYVWD